MRSTGGICKSGSLKIAKKCEECVKKGRGRYRRRDSSSYAVINERSTVIGGVPLFERFVETGIRNDFELYNIASSTPGVVLQ